MNCGLTLWRETRTGVIVLAVISLAVQLMSSVGKGFVIWTVYSL